MSERKNIDKLFQDRFKDFEVAPAAEVWGNIEEKLDEKRKRRIIPLWWKFSGVAAVLLVGLLIMKPFSGSEIKPENNVVIDANSPSSEKNTVPTDSKKQGIPTPPGSNQTSGIAADTAEGNKSNTGIVEGNKSNPEGNKKTVGISNSSKKAIAESTTSARSSLKNRQNKTKQHTALSESILEKSSHPLAENNKNEGNVLPENKIAAVDPNNNNSKTTTNNKTINLDDLKGDANSNSKIVTTEKKVTDTTKIAGVTTNALEELLNEKESKVKQKSKENRWEIASNVAPVFLGSVSEGSAIDPMFEKNSKDYKTNVSLGLGVSYALNNKLTVRTGINKITVDYDTNGIVFFADLENAGIKNVSASTGGKEIHVENVAPDLETSIGETNGLLPFENAIFNKNEGYINQKMGYYEVPLELTYAVLNKRFGLKVIGGMSTFFLNENSISVVSDNMSANLGKANNLNDVHFSTNIGLGIKYGIYKSFEFNIEPTLKYQLNTFSSNAGNFKPYIFGIYSGISYKF